MFYHRNKGKAQLTSKRVQNTTPAADAANAVQGKDALISLISLLYIEEYALLSAHQLESARQDLNTLFVEASGEETSLRKLIDTLLAQKVVDHTFGELAQILEGIDRGFHTVQEKISHLRHQLSKQSISAEEHRAFIGPFLSFCHDFTERLDRFRRLMNEYLDAREREARAAYIFEIARKARERIKRRLDQVLHNRQPRHEMHIARVTKTFDYSEAQVNHEFTTGETARVREEIETVLNEFHEMCQFAVSPERRDAKAVGRLFDESPYADVFSLYTSARTQYDNLTKLEADVRELFRLFQHAYGISRVDFDRFDHTLGEISKNTETYFRTKREDQDVLSIRDKLKRIEALLRFLERCAYLLSKAKDDTYETFSHTISDTISTPGTAWSAISDDLLRMKVTAEAELNARLA